MFHRLTTWLALALVLAVCLTALPLQAVASDGAGNHGPAAEEKFEANPLTFKTDLAIWTGIIFLVLMAILYFFAWGPINDGLQKRESRIADDIAAAQKSNEDAKQLLASYEQKLARASDEVRQLLEQARRDASEVGRQIVDKARSDAEAEHRRALGEIDQATSAALKELSERSATLAVDLAGKIVGSRLDPAAHSRLIEQAVRQFAQTKANGN